MSLHVFLSQLRRELDESSKEETQEQSQNNRTPKDCDYEKETKSTSSKIGRKIGAKGKRPEEMDSDDDLKAERRAANRRSAFKSRQRRKLLVEDLQKMVANLSKENTELQNDNKEMRGKLENTKLQNQLIKQQILILQQQQQQHKAPAFAVGVQKMSADPQHQPFQLQANSNSSPLSSLGFMSAARSEGPRRMDPLSTARLILSSAQVQAGTATTADGNNLGTLSDFFGVNGSGPTAPTPAARGGQIPHAAGIQNIAEASTIDDSRNLQQQLERLLAKIRRS